MLFDAHTRSFAALGGVARRGIYDNMKTAVDKVPRGKGGKGGKGRIVNARFAVMCAHYLFDADFCNVASGWEKGVVEKNVQDSRRRIWIDAQTRKWHSFEELNAWLTHHCHIVETGNESFRFRHSTLAAKTRIKARESARRGGLAVPALLEVGAVDAVDEESEVDEPF